MAETLSRRRRSSVLETVILRLSVVVGKKPERESALNSDIGEVNGSGGARALPGATPTLNEPSVGSCE